MSEAEQLRATLAQFPSVDASQNLIARLDAAHRRAGELEALYGEGLATEAQLAELERLRLDIDWYYEGLDMMGYFDPQ